jgi:hypothetical protein
MSRCGWCGVCAGEDGVDLAGEVALDVADDLAFGFAFCDAPVHVFAGARVVAQADQGDAEQGGVGLSVAAAVEPVAVGFAVLAMILGFGLSAGEQDPFAE